MPPEGSPLVLARELGRDFGRRRVVAGLNLQLGPGQSVAVVGPNGSGKSTVLRLLATIVRPTSGTAAICGHDVQRQAKGARACLGVSFAEDRAWYWRLTGRQNLAFFARLRGVEVPLDALSAVGLEDVETPVGQWSTGMRTRLGVARALLGQPPVLLLDEPTRAVDSRGAALLHNLFRAHCERGGALVIATHETEEMAGADFLVRLG